MKLLTILLIITHYQAQTQTYRGFHLAPTYTIVNTKNDTIKSFDNINSFKLGLNLEIFPADYFSLSVDPTVNFVKIRYYTNSGFKMVQPILKPCYGKCRSCICLVQ